MKLYRSKNFTPFTVNVKKSDNNNHQLIYASQLYGTFFAVGAKLLLSDDKKSLIGMELALNNYKGLYNIGFLKQTEDSWDVVKKTAVIILHVQVDDSHYTNNVKRKRTITLEKPVLLSSIDELFVGRQLHCLSSASPVDHLDDAIFDSEFYVRNGSYIAKIDRMDDDLPGPPKTNAPTGGSPTSHCMSTLAKLI